MFNQIIFSICLDWHFELSMIKKAHFTPTTPTPPFFSWAKVEEVYLDYLSLFYFYLSYFNQFNMIKHLEPTYTLITWQIEYDKARII